MVHMLENVIGTDDIINNLFNIQTHRQTNVLSNQNATPTINIKPNAPLVCWGSNEYSQTDIPPALHNTSAALLTANGAHSCASTHSL